MDGQIHAGGSTALTNIEPSIVRDWEADVNEKVFSRLASDHDEANRTCEFLEQALRSAKIRYSVLTAAMEVLNAPAKAEAPPTLR